MACMRKIEKPSPTESPLLFELDPKPAEEVLTALGGLPLVVQAFRSLGLPGSVKQHVAVKERQRGYDEATFVESRKQEALHTYEGPRGYQPMLAVWAEMDVVLADEFRDGNVPAQMAPLTVAKAAFAALPKTVTSYYYRGDSACHEKELLRWLSNEKRAEGPQGCIGFAISVRMSEALRAAIREVPEKEWKAYGEPEPGIDRECAEVVL